ncbi:MAG: Fe-S protein assembly co-chaperone HscB [Chitinophagaceae bacterium]|nr:Fe-S protein assembly co-chaperone HscB [Chitinophagaceae bacterium]
MNYFEIFHIPLALKVNKDELTGKYFELSRQFHPDYFANGSDKEQMDALENSALLNKAYKTFQQPDETIKYVLGLKGLLQEEEKYELPPAFLMEVLEINEQLMDLETDEDKAGLRLAVENLEKDLYEPVKEIIEHYKEGITSEEELLQVKEYYYKKKYLDRIRKELH